MGTSSHYDSQGQAGGDQDIHRVRAGLDRLERGEWWRWSAALVIMLLLTAGVFVLTQAEGVLGFSENGRIVNAEHGLVALVLLFDGFVIYQRLIMGRLRRQLATQMMAIATLEAMGPRPQPEDQTERRSRARLGIDELLKVEMAAQGRKRLAYGRIVNIDDTSMGAVVPETMTPGDNVTLLFTLGRSAAFRLQAVVCHRRGFHYGFEFRQVSESVAQNLAGALQAMGEPGN
jgi:hypothetical protein